MGIWTPLMRESPFCSIKMAIYLFRQRQGNCIIEIGCMRQRFTHPIDQEPADCPSRLDGHSTVHFAATGKEFFSVDIDEANVKLAKEYTEKYKKTKIINMDGILFLDNFQKKCDLLMLDAWDVDVPNCSKKHLEAVVASKKNLHNKSIIIIDDCDVRFVDGKLEKSKNEFGGKGELAIPYLLNLGWKIFAKGRCVILSQI